MSATLAARPIETRIRAAEKAGVFAERPDANVRDIADVAHALGVVTSEEHAVLRQRNRLRDIVIRVDDFPHDFGVRRDEPVEQRAVA